MYTKFSTVYGAEMTNFALLPLLSPQLAAGAVALVSPGALAGAAGNLSVSPRLDPETWVFERLPADRNWRSSIRVAQ